MEFVIDAYELNIVHGTSSMCNYEKRTRLAIHIARRCQYLFFIVW